MPPPNLTALDQYAALLHTPWKAGKAPNEIVGNWAEDGSEYLIMVPPQLRDMLVDLQNALADSYARIQILRAQLVKAERETQVILGETRRSLREVR